MVDITITKTQSILSSRLIFEYWNGDSNKAISDTFINNDLKLKFPFKSKYLTLIISYKLKNGSKVTNTYFVDDKPSKLILSEKESNVGQIDFLSSKNIIHVNDTSTNYLFRDVIKQRQKLGLLLSDLYMKYGGKIDASDSLKTLRNKYYRELNVQTMKYLQDHSNDYFSLWYFGNQVVSPSISLLRADTTYLKSLILYFNKTFPKKYKHSYEGKYILQMLEGAIHPPFVNSQAPKFSKIDLSGKKISLNSFKNKYVLIDFWASWCIPCLSSVPVLIDLKNKYSADKFEIIGISIDEDKAKMKTTIKDRKMNWYHLWDNDNELSNIYSVFKIPTFLLIDQNGIIVFRGLGLEDKEKVVKFLEEKL